MAAFMACGHAKFTGDVGVCLATSGPGAIHLLNGLYDAKLDRQSVLAIVGQQARSALGGAYQQEVDLHTLLQEGPPDFPYARYAQFVGLHGIRVDDPEQVGLGEALAADRPVVLDVIVDSEVPPLPPHITFEQGEELHARGRPLRRGPEGDPRTLFEKEAGGLVPGR
jgi:pyruvate dehydrogenase (quinone)